MAKHSKNQSAGSNHSNGGSHGSSNNQSSGLDWYPEKVVAGVHTNGHQTDVLLHGNDAAVDALINQLQSHGMNTLELDAGQLAQMADQGDISLNHGVDVSVIGTSFLSHATEGHLQHLLGDADLTVRMDWNDIGKLVNAGDAALDALTHTLKDVGMDTLALEAGQVSKLANNDFSIDAGTHVVVDDASFLTDPYGASLAELHQLLAGADVTVKIGMEDLGNGNLQSALSGLQHELSSAGVDHLQLTDDLANALAEADTHFLSLAGQDQVVVAAEDNQSGVSYLSASLEDLRNLGVDHVQAGTGVGKIEVALRDSDSTGHSFSLADLPHFDAPAGTEVSLVVDQDDLAALLADHNAFAKLAADGVTELHYTGGNTPAHLADQLAANGLHLDTSALTPTEVQLLGLADDGTTHHAAPTDPHHKG